MLSTLIVITGALIASWRWNIPPLMKPGSLGMPLSPSGPVITIVYCISGISCVFHPNTSL